jgi:hypothetical protein
LTFEVPNAVEPQRRKERKENAKFDFPIDAVPFFVFLLCVRFALFAPLRFENSSRRAKITRNSNTDR